MPIFAKDLKHEKWKDAAVNHVIHCERCLLLIFWTMRDPSLGWDYIYPSGIKNGIAFNALPGHKHDSCAVCTDFNKMKNDPLAGYQHVCYPCTEIIDPNCCPPSNPTLVVLHPPKGGRMQYMTNVNGMHVREHKPRNKGYYASGSGSHSGSGHTNTNTNTNTEQEQEQEQKQEQNEKKQPEPTIDSYQQQPRPQQQQDIRSLLAEVERTVKALRDYLDLVLQSSLK